MQVRAKKVAPRHKGQTQKQPAQGYTFPAMVGGWVLSENPALASRGTARVLDNWICTTTGIKARGGKTRLATLNAAAVSLFRYESGSQEKVFAATATEITDVTTVGSPTVPEPADVTGLTSGDWSAQQFGTAGGDFLMIVNGADAARYWDGSTWNAHSITGVTTSNLSQVWSFANRLFFVEEGTQSAWYLPVDSIGGAATEFSLAGVFKRGGSLLFGASWSMDAGDGLDDKCVFMSDQGEVVVYSGTNPGSASTWSLQGRYDMPKPLGKKAFTSAGGDLLIATETGLIPVSAAIRLDVSAQSGGAFSAKIASYWQDQATSITAGWEMVKIPRENIMIVSQPSTTDDTALCVNLQTGAWSRFTGWDTQCVSFYQNRGVFADADGYVFTMNTGGSDDGAIYTCRALGAFEQLGIPGQTKSTLQSRYIFQAGGPYNAKLTMKTDFDLSASTPPASPANYTVDAWDVGQWDVAVWDANSTVSSSAQWTSTPGTGVFFAPELQLTFGITSTPDVELVSIDTMFSTGGIAT